MQKEKLIKPPKKSIGPVSNLEIHVHPDWWKRIFNPLYLKTDADVISDPNITRNEINLFSEFLKLTPDDKILDLCCGQGRHVIELAKRGFQVIGLDRSRFLIQKAKALSKKENLNIKFKEGDARKIPFQFDSYEVVTILGNSFGYFETIHDDLIVLKEVFRILKPSGRILIQIADGQFLKKNYQARSWEWMDKKHFVCRERSLSSDEQRLISREVISNTDKGVIADQFYAERLYTKDEIKDLMTKAGFKDIQYHGELSPNSQRNQDLGMMEQCIIISGKAQKDWAPIKRKPKQDIKEILVVLGDPNLPDKIKPMSIFDEDDQYTVDQLKTALRSLTDYKFTYLMDHHNFIQDLKKYSGKVQLVFNLCDEGYNNDPRKELHVPALLEILDMPFTGSSTQCLAYCYDKSLVRGIAKEMNIPVPEAFFINPDDTTFDLPFDFPVIVKPNFGDSSFGITQNSVAHNLDQLIVAISKIRDTLGYDKPVLVEEFLPDKDISVGIVGNPPGSYVILPIIEEDYSSLPEGYPRICGYEAKWLADSPYGKITSIPVQLPERTKTLIEECCIKLFERLECRDYARFDWRMDSAGNPKLLEVNPNPGWCWDGHLAKMAAIGGVTYRDLLRDIIQSAEQRIEFQKLSNPNSTAGSNGSS